MSSPAILVERLSKHFGSLRAVDEISFSIQPSEVVGFVGPNGAGKTTTIGLLLGFLRSTNGSASVLGHKISPENAHKSHKDIGYVAGDMELFDNLTGEQYLAFLGHRYGGAPRQKELIKLLQPMLGQRLKKLSRGNKQKVALVGAFQHDPKVAILDEPTSGLDPLMQETFLHFVKQERARGVTIFMSSHILSEVATACDRVMFMKTGKIITNQPVKKLEEAAGKVVTVSTTKTDVKSMSSHLLDGTKLIKKTSTTLKLSYKGDVKRLLRWLNTHPITDVSVNDFTLDDIFHDMYKEAVKK